MHVRLTRGTALVGAVCLRNGVVLFDGIDPPVNGTSGTGAGFAGPGSVYFRTSGKQYVNIGTKSSPVWQATIIAAASPSPSTSPSKSPSASASPS